jgi:AcrR family transcriptional regulator
MTVFWQRGYAGASVDALAAAMQINKPSLYAAFGSKETLFREALALYGTVEGAPVQRALDDASTARQAVEGALRANANLYTVRGKPRGCMIGLSALQCPPDDERVRRIARRTRHEGEAAIRRRIERGIADGDVPATADAKTMAAFYTAVTHGLAVQARDGVSRATLNAIVEGAMGAWEQLAAGNARTNRDPIIS